jgi:hypothetical protein
MAHPCGAPAVVRQSECPQWVESGPSSRSLNRFVLRRAGLVCDKVRGESLDRAILYDVGKLSLQAEAPLSLLQVALAQLEQRKDGNLLTFAAYREMGGVAGAIRSHARDALAEWQTDAPPGAGPAGVPSGAARPATTHRSPPRAARGA